MINLTKREGEILRILSEDRSTSVGKISKRLSVSEVTVRNHLNSLAEKGFVVRTHGGAFPAFHETIIERQKLMVEAKGRIARAAAELVGDASRIMISAGTTTALVPKYLLGKLDVHLVTNSTFLLPYVRVNPAIQTTFVGGTFVPSGEAMVGPVALQAISQFHVEMAFVGADGFSPESGATAHLTDVAEVVRKMSERAEETILLMDSSKYGREGFAQMLPAEKIQMIITDAKLKPDDKAMLKEKGVKLTVV
ncbi:MAG: DeoR/GlpR family DNA-binding transcription regulator [Planctomycetota bacterium]